MKQKSSLSEIFIGAFVSELILNSKSDNEESIEPEKFPEMKLEPSEKRIPLVPVTKPMIIRRYQPEVKENYVPQTQKENPPIPISAPKTGYPDLGKINFLISDPTIESIECQGPNKKILVKLGARVQRTNVSLTDDEIKDIILEFSKRTRIPLIEGTFKAALNNLIITAVISEFVGTRFIIQKKINLIR